MAYTSAATKIVLSGTIAGAQTWSTGVWWTSPTQTVPQNSDELATNLEAIVDAIETWWTSGMNAQNPSSVKLTKATAYAYGLTSGPALAISEVNLTGLQGLGTTYTLPSFTSMAVSLRTARAGGRYRGRMYLPLLNNSLTGLFQFSTAAVPAIASSTADLLSAINDSWAYPGAPNPHGAVVIRSGIGQVMTPVTSVIVDDLPDTQHRRENALGSAQRVTDTVSPYTP